ncbi:MAG: hypothetical protein HY291_05555 [Planctomycetes bacterium]|nr:hypothetical protein [Planctomycetota bacterium]
MKNINETLDMLQTVQEVVSVRLKRLREEGGDEEQIEREERRQRLLQETIKAVEEATLASAN